MYLFFPSLTTQTQNSQKNAKKNPQLVELCQSSTKGIYTLCNVINIDPTAQKYETCINHTNKEILHKPMQEMLNQQTATKQYHGPNNLL